MAQVRLQLEGPCGKRVGKVCIDPWSTHYGCAKQWVVPLGKKSGKVKRLMRKEVISVDQSPLFRFNADEKRNSETYVTASLGLDENTNYFFPSWNLTGSVHVWVFSI